ncbi:MAG: hypothetical protein LIO93_12150 [Bacteroidales bacterium]|nr:hypothetical protein [Bacteroidales bacterium]
MPRLTTQERDAISPKNEIPDGLMIYNTTTHCYNYFNAVAGTGGDWVSLCGTQDPATFELSDCSGTISPDPATNPGSYKVGVPLTSANTYAINVRVTQPGTYNILLITDNGYSFSKSGVFTQAGVIATIALEGQGVPVRESITPGDTPYLQFNGMTVTPSCPGNTSLPVIPVAGTSARYSFDCNSLVLGPGSYKKGQVVNPAQHYVDIDINITQDGIATIEALPEGDANGIAFRSDPIDMKTGNSPQTVRLYASGIPTNNGTFSYKIGDACIPFSITVASDIGSFSTPAKSCYEIYLDDNTKPDGEYWIQARNGSRDAVKTFCDMTNGGYTLVWSFSEKTLQETYYNSGTNGMSMYNSGLYLSANKPLNIVTSESGTINYFNYRLSGPTMQNVKQDPTTPSLYKVRIAYDPKKINDYWALENFMDIQPQSTRYDLIASTAGNSYTWSGTDIKATGKLFNLDYNQTSGNTVVYGGLTTTSATSAFYYGRTPYVNHWDAGFRLRNTTLQTEVTKIDGSKYTMNVNPHHFDNIFGAINEDEITHHIGKCVNIGSTPSQVDDYGDATSRCAYTRRFPHSFNGGEGRVVQWFVK